MLFDTEISAFEHELSNKVAVLGAAALGLNEKELCKAFSNKFENEFGKIHLHWHNNKGKVNRNWKWQKI